jgi:hypothetical protein
VTADRPGRLDSYDVAAPMAQSMAGAIESGAMPPWGAQDTETCTPRFGWKGDLRLSADEKAILRAWADGGAPEGDPDDAVTLPEPPNLTLDRVDQDLTPLRPYTTGGTEDEYVCFSIDPGLTDDTWLTGVQVEPGNGQVVHHVLVFVDTTGESAALAGEDGQYDCFGGVDDAQLAMVWVPGATAFEVPEGSAMQVPAGSRYVLQVHYHPGGLAAAEDLTHVQLRYQSSWPSSLTYLTLLGNAFSAETGLHDDPDDRYGFPEFRIPAGSPDHVESMSAPLTGLPDLALFLVGTHMHYVGVDMQINLVHGDPQGDEPDEECLLQTPAWDFDWQRSYVYDAPIGEGVMVRGTDTLEMWCRYDNTLDNPGVLRSLEDAGLDEPQDVYLGEATTDEMCLGMFGVVYEF